MRILFLLLILVNLVILMLNHEQIQPRGTLKSYQPVAGAVELELVGTSEIKSEAVKPLDGICIEFGPIPSLTLAQRIQTDLKARSHLAELTRSKEQNDVRYWVIHGPLSDGAEAESTLARFHSKGVDSFVIRSGVMVNAISLGVFDNAESAERSVARHEALGIDAKIHQSEVENNRFWIGVNLPYTIENNNKIRQLARLHNVLPDLGQIFCKNLASP